MSEPPELTNPQKRQLKALAHARKPVVIIGAQGVTPAVLREIQQALDHHELLKVRIHAANRLDREAMSAELCRQTGAFLVQRIGGVVTLFRPNPSASRVVLA